jgi:hypothetical protein
VINQFQLKARVFDLVTREELTPDSAAQRISREDRETYLLAGGKNIEALAKGLSDEWKHSLGPLSRAYMAYHYAEIGLRGDLQAALAQLELDNPHDIRDVVRAIGKVVAQEEWGSAGEPRDLLDALELLDEAGVDVSGYRARVDALYPKVADDDDNDTDAKDA